MNSNGRPGVCWTIVSEKQDLRSQTFKQLQFAFLSRKIPLKVFNGPRSLCTEGKDLKANTAYIVNKYVLISYNVCFKEDLISLRM